MLTQENKTTLASFGATVEGESIRLATGHAIGWRLLPRDPAEDISGSAVGAVMIAAQHADRAKTADRDAMLSAAGKTARRSESDRATLPRLGEALARIAALRSQWQTAHDEFMGRRPAPARDMVEALADAEVRRWLESANTADLMPMVEALNVDSGQTFDPRLPRLIEAWARAPYPCRPDLLEVFAAAWKRLQEITNPDTAARLRVRDEHTGWLVVVGQQCAAAVRAASVVGEAEQFAAIDRAGGEPALLLAGWQRSQFEALRMTRSATLPAAA